MTKTETPVLHLPTPIDCLQTPSVESLLRLFFSFSVCSVRFTAGHVSQPSFPPSEGPLEANCQLVFPYLHFLCLAGPPLAETAGLLLAALAGAVSWLYAGRALVFFAMVCLGAIGMADSGTANGCSLKAASC